MPVMLLKHRLLSGLAALLFAIGLEPAAADEIVVAVAANFAKPMAALVERFEAETAHRVRITTGSTGKHYAQIRNGAPFDAFFAADAERPRLLEDAGVGVPGSRFTYAIGRLALWSPRSEYVDAEGKILEDGGFRHLAIANPSLAPYGAAARDVLAAKGVLDALERKLVFGEDVGQTFGFVHSGAAELGFVAYAQLVADDGVGGSHWLVPAALHAPIEQQALLLVDSPAARAFVEFVTGDAARAIIERFGYGT